MGVEKDGQRLREVQVGQGVADDARRRSSACQHREVHVRRAFVMESAEFPVHAVRFQIVQERHDQFAVVAALHGIPIHALQLHDHHAAARGPDRYARHGRLYRVCQSRLNLGLLSGPTWHLFHLQRVLQQHAAGIGHAARRKGTGLAQGKRRGRMLQE